MKNAVVTKAIRSSADPERSAHFFQLLSETSANTALAKISAPQANLLAALFSGSQVLGNQLVSHPEWLAHLEIEHLRFPRRDRGLSNEVQGWLKDLLNVRDYATAFSRIREFNSEKCCASRRAIWHGSAMCRRSRAKFPMSRMSASKPSGESASAN